MLPTSLRAQSLSGDITVSQAIYGNHDLSLKTNGQIRIERDLGGASNLTALTSLSVEGNAILAISGNQTLRTSGSQTFTGAVTLDTNASLIAGSVRLQGSVDGASSLAITTTGNTRLDGEVGGSTRLTQAEYARICKVSEKTLREVEKGKTDPRLSIIESLLNPGGFALSARLKVNRVVPMAELVRRGVS